MMKRNVPSTQNIGQEIPSKSTTIVAPSTKSRLVSEYDLRDLKNSAGIRMWLFAYNIINTVGWLYIFGWIFLNWALEGTFTLKYSFEETKMLTSFLLIVVFLDLVHEYLGWVGNNDVNVFVRAHCKVLRRAHFYFAALWFLPEAQRHHATGLTLFTWAFLDLIRYPFYALNIFRISPPFLTWARYSAFIVFYPIGFLFESWVWFLMLPHIAEKELHANPTVSYYFPALRYWFFYWSILYVAYRFITFPINFRRMLRDRRIKLFGETTQDLPPKEEILVKKEERLQTSEAKD